MFADNGISSEFLVTIVLHLGSAFSTYLFTLVMDKMTREIQDKVTSCMLFADDIVIANEIIKCLSRRSDN